MEDLASGPHLNLVVLRTHRLDHTRRFYEALGLRFVDEQHGDGPHHLATTLPSGIVLELYPRAVIGAEWPVDDIRLGFVVADAEKVFAAAIAAGGRRVSAPAPTARGLVAVVNDPDYRSVELLEPVGDGSRA